MTWRSSAFIAANAALFIGNMWVTTTHAQLPPDTSPDGVPYLKVNINPTPVPPLVNINPSGQVPLVEVSRMPEIKILPKACENPANFDSRVGRTVSGPISVTFLMVPQAVDMTFVDSSGTSHRIPFNPANQFGSAIDLKAGETLAFNSDVMYSGCRPIN